MRKRSDKISDLDKDLRLYAVVFVLVCVLVGGQLFTMFHNETPTQRNETTKVERVEV